MRRFRTWIHSDKCEINKINEFDKTSEQRTIEPIKTIESCETSEPTQTKPN